MPNTLASDGEFPSA
ncbi:hypothetical protein Ga0076813_14918, partial [endosymbiont of Ridgeia piscesae]